MANFAAGTVATENYLPASFVGRVAAAYEKAPQFQAADHGVGNVPALAFPVVGALVSHTGAKSTFAAQNFAAQPRDEMTPAIDFFEDWHVLPRSVALGNILATQLVSFEVFSAFRHTRETWNTFVNNAGAGVSLVGAPGLPATAAPLHGFSFQLQVDPSGAPSVDTTLDFGFDIGTIYVPITFDRVVLFDMPPELPYLEELEFLTDILLHTDGSEQRAALRKNPRQFFEWNILLADGPERARIHNKLFDWQSRVFGIPVWHELTFSTAAATAGALTINVQSTNFADYRVGGLVLVYRDQTTFDVLELASFTSTSVTVVNPILNSYSTGVMVMPLRTGVLEQVAGSRWAVNLAAIRARFRVDNNDANLGDTSAFPTFNSKVLLTDGNGITGTFSESFERKVIQVDSRTGIVYQDSPWDRSRRGSGKTFLCNSRQALWNVRRLVHALRGRQVSFYLPTFAKDLEPVDPLILGASGMNIRHCGYTQFVRQRQPQNAIRLVFTDNTTLLRTVIGSSVLDATKEALTLNTTWPAGVPVANISRVEYVEKVRFNSDSIQFQHFPGDRTTKIAAPVLAVLE